MKHEWQLQLCNSSKYWLKKLWVKSFVSTAGHYCELLWLKWMLYISFIEIGWKRTEKNKTKGCTVLMTKLADFLAVSAHLMAVRIRTHSSINSTRTCFSTTPAFRSNSSHHVHADNVSSLNMMILMSLHPFLFGMNLCYYLEDYEY